MKPIPKPRESKIVLIRKFMKEGTLPFCTHLFRQYGDIVRMGITDLILTNHPEFAKHIFYANQSNYFSKDFPQVKYFKEFIGEDGLVTVSNYKVWLKDRTIADPHFAQSSFKDHAPIIVKNCLEMMNGWDLSIKPNATINVNASLAELALNNFTTTLLRNIVFDFKSFNRANHLMLHEVISRGSALSQLPWILPTANKHRYYDSLKIIDNIVYKIIEERLQAPSRVEDLLGSYINAYADDKDRKKVIAHLRNHVMTFLYAGHDTVTGTMSWTLLVLSAYPEIERRVRHEIDSVLNGRLATYDDLKNIPYTRAVLSEVARLYPTIPLSTPRAAANDDEITDYAIHKDEFLMVCLYHVHRHPDYWENPEGFDPERFIKNPWYNHNRFAYLPGTGGERHCIGIHFAMMEAHLTLITLLQRYRFTILPGDSLGHTYNSVLWPYNNFMMKVERTT
jgi:cytochrome P450